MRLRAYIFAIVASGILWANPVSPFTGTCGIWGQKRNGFVASNFAGTQAGFDAAKAYVGTNGAIFIYGGCEGLLTIGTLQDSVFVYAYDSAKWTVYGKAGSWRDRSGQARLDVDSLGIRVTGTGIIPRLGPASSAGSGGAIRIVDGVTFAQTQAGLNAALSDLPALGGLVYVPSSYAGQLGPTSIPSGASILTSEMPGKTILRGDIPTNSGKLILWNSQATNLSAVNALPYDSTIVQNQLAVNLRGAGATRIPVGIFSWVNVEGDMSVGQSAKDVNAVFAQIDVNGPSPLPASYGDVAGEFAVVLRGTSATALPDERGILGRINGNSNQPITRAVGVFGSVGTTASAIKAGYSFYGTAPVLSGSGTIDTSVTARFNMPSSAAVINRALHAEGETSVGGTIASPRIVFDRSAGGGVEGNKAIFSDSLRANKGLYVGGQFVNKMDGNTATLNFGAPAAVPGSVDLTITVNGAAFGDQTIVGSPVTIGANYVLTSFVSAANTVTVRWTQIAGAAADPDGGGGTYTVRIVK